MTYNFLWDEKSETEEQHLSDSQDKSMSDGAHIQRPKLPFYSKEAVEHKNRTLQTLYSISNFIQQEGDLNEKIYHCLNISSHPVPVYKVKTEKNGKAVGIVEFFPGNQRIAGRSKRADIILDDPEVSSVHCILTSDSLGQLTIMDTASLNGTYLNGRRLQSLKKNTISPVSRITTGSTDWRISRTLNHHSGKSKFNLSPSLKIMSDRQFETGRHRCTVKDKNGSHSFDFYISLSNAHELLLEYFGLPPGHPALTALADQLLFELETVFIEALLKRVNLYIPEHFQLEYFYGETKVSEALIQCDFELCRNANSYTISFFVDPVSFSGFCIHNKSRFLKLSKPAFPGITEMLPITFCCISQNFVLNQNQFDSLKSGDVLFPGWFVQETFEKSLPSPSVYLAISTKKRISSILECGCHFKRDKVLLRVVDIGINKEDIMNQTQDAMSAEGVTSMCETRFLDLSNEPIVAVRIEIGHLQLSMGELCNLKPGMLLSFDKKIDEPVNIMVTDEVVGTGRLIQIHEEYGVEILSWKESR